MSATFRAFASSHGLDCTYHSPRHTAASLMLASGTSERSPGDSATRAPRRRWTYSHLIWQADRDAADRLEVLLSRSPG